MADIMTMNVSIIGGRECRVFQSGDARALLVQVVSGQQAGELESELEQIAASDVGFVMVAVPIADWELELMPWAEPAVSRRPEVGSGAGSTLRFIVESLLPWWNGQRAGQPAVPVVLGGYSLGGLFSLWAACQTDRFAAVAAGSPSLWAGNWPEYAATHPMLARQVYLSLGDREERSRNKIMACVGERIRDEHDRLVRQLGGGRTMLHWEQGGHFADPAGRMARAFSWCLKHTTE